MSPGPDRFLKSLPDLDEQLVGGIVAVGVVDELEVVEVEQDQRHRSRRRPCLPFERDVQAVGEQNPVRQLGQPIVEHPTAKLSLGEPGFGDVGDHGERPELVGVRRRQCERSSRHRQDV